MARPTRVGGLTPDMPASEAARRLLEGRLSDARRRAEIFVRAPAAGSLHDLRVALRRLRAALELFGAEDARRQELKRLMRPLGGCRDAQLRLDWLRVQGPRGGALHRHEARRLAASLPRAVDRVRRWLWARLPAFERLAAHAGPRGRFGGHRLRRRLLSLRRQVERLLEGLGPDSSPRDAHRLRIRVKRFRYAAELLEPTDPVPLRRLLKRLVPLQRALGELHDADVRIAWLTRVRSAEGRRLLERARRERSRLFRALP
ncbi:MAG: CHAD domain-containing protein [Myxococcales bacterium]